MIDKKNKDVEMMFGEREQSGRQTKYNNIGRKESVYPISSK
jgi:hypothetical protein